MSTEKRSNTEANEIEATTPDNGVVCLNCGAVCHSKFCPDCGQPTSTPQRISHLSFAKMVAMSYARLTPGFWPTLKGLLTAPWKVIADYVNGKRIVYSPPVTMFIQTILYVTLILTTINRITGIEFSFISNYDADIQGYNNWFIRALFESDVFVCFVIVTPIALAGYLTYHKRSKRRFNFAEFMVGAIYMANLFIIIDILCIPIEKLVNDTVSDIILYSVIFFYSISTIRKAFPMKSWRKHLWCICKFVFLTAIELIVLCILLALAFGEVELEIS